MAAQQSDPLAEARRLLQLVQTSLDDDQAVDPVVIELSGKSTIADYMVIASGRSQRHVGAMADNLFRKMKSAGFGGAVIEGAERCDWVLLDAGDVIIHLFHPEVRAFYGLEKMWGIDLPNRTTAGGEQAHTMA